jgi:hypothetical protein
LKCQYDAFADYVKEAEAKGIERIPSTLGPKRPWMTRRSKRSTPSPSRFMSAATRFTKGSKADALEAELKPLVGGPIVAQMFRYDTDPAHNPHPQSQE